MDTKQPFRSIKPVNLFNLCEKKIKKYSRQFHEMLFRL